MMQLMVLKYLQLYFERRVAHELTFVRFLK